MAFIRHVNDYNPNVRFFTDNMSHFKNLFSSYYASSLAHLMQLFYLHLV